MNLIQHALASVREWALRLIGTWRPARTDEDLARELTAHLELATDDARRDARSADAATRAAAIRAGATAQAMEALRDQRALPWIDDLTRDLRHGIRLLRRNPIFSAVAVVSLGLGIGANSAIFSLTDALLLRPLAVRDPGSVVTVSADTANTGFSGGRLSYPNYRDLRAASQSFDGLIAYQIATVSFGRSRDSVREMRIGMLVSDNFFDVLGVGPALGRSFTPGEARVPGRGAVVVLGYDFWKNSLGGDASILDQTVWMNGIGFHVIGVTPQSFAGGTEVVLRPAFYVPLTMSERLSTAPKNPLEDREARSFWIKGRLKPGVSKERARAELAVVWERLQQEYPDVNRGRTIAVRTELQERIRQDPWDAAVMSILVALAAIVLTIACANVANLMLGRGRARSREMAIRLSLGVGRARLVRQLLTESFVLAFVGLLLGLAFAYATMRFLDTLPTPEQIVIKPQLDERVLVFSLAAAAVSAILFGVAPARQSLRTSVVPALKGSELGDEPAQRPVARNILVVAQVALSMVLLVAMGMMLDGFRKAIVLNPGFRTDHLFMISLDTSFARYTPAQTHAFYRELRERVEALTGVSSAALTSSVPFLPGDQTTFAVVPEGYDFPPGQVNANIFGAVVDERYFKTMHIDIVRGRGFTADDKADSRPVAVINEELAKRYWPNQDPIGKRIRLNTTDSPWREIVGVTKTGKYTWIAETPMPFFYMPFAQHERTDMSMLVETNTLDPALLAAPLREVVRTLDVNQPVFNAQTFQHLYYDRTIKVPLIIMQMVGAMGVLGLTLALVGLYALVAYAVARRTREIGIRMAIGAGKGDVLRMVLRQGLTLALSGTLVGGVVSVAVATVLTRALAGVGTPNPATYVIVPAALICLTMAATLVPARRAARLDPVTALRLD